MTAKFRDFKHDGDSPLAAWVQGMEAASHYEKNYEIICGVCGETDAYCDCLEKEISMRVDNINKLTKEIG